MVKQKNEEVLTKFSIDDEGNLVIAKWGATITTYTYQDKSGNKLSEAQKQNIPQENVYEDVSNLDISLYSLPVNYKQYIKKYIMNYGFLSDLLVVTNNVNFCLDVAQMAVDSKIVFNLKEELRTVDTTSKTDYTQTKLLYDYIDYQVSGQISDEAGGTTIYETGTDKLINLNGNHINESYENYIINEDYTRGEKFTYTIVQQTHTENCGYDLDISEIDSWFLKYKKKYSTPTLEQKSSGSESEKKGQFSQEFETVANNSIQNDDDVQAFIKLKEAKYRNDYPEVETIECNVTELIVKQKVKTDEYVKHSSIRTSYKFGEDEEETDTTETRFKNIEYVNGQTVYTPKDENGNPEIGFLSIYDRYINNDEDLFLENDSEKMLFELLESDSQTSGISDIIKYLLYVYDGIDRGVKDLDKTFKVIDISLSGGSIGASAFGCNLTKEEFIAATEQYQGDSILATLAELFYDTCAEYNVNPCLAYVWAAYESGWGKSAVEDKNLFQMGTYTDQTSGFKYNSYEDSIRAFCEWLVEAADVSSNLYSFCMSRAEEYATVNNKFKGRPDNNIYALLSTFANVGYVHNGNTRACIRMTYDYLNDGIYECNHTDDEPVTMQERADYMDFIISSRIDLSKKIFGVDCFLGHGSIVEAAYEVADYFMNSGVDVHYAAAHKNGNNIVLPDQHNIQACWDLPIKSPDTYGIVCTTFVNLALWKSGLIDTETINTFALHSPILSAMAMESLEGWEVITDASELQEGDIVYTAEPAHTWIYMEGDKMLDQTYCVINSDGYDSRGVLKDASWGIAGFTKAFRYVGE